MHALTTEKKTVAKERFEYEPSEGVLVYRPPGYGIKTRKRQRHCCLCHLKPCVFIEYRNDVMLFIGRCSPNCLEPAHEMKEILVRYLTVRHAVLTGRRSGKTIPCVERKVEDLLSRSCKRKIVQEKRKRKAQETGYSI